MMEVKVVASMNRFGCDPDDLKKMYTEERMTIKAIGEVYNTVDGTVRKWLKGCNIEIRKKGLFFNQHYFDTIDTEEKAYWLGFIWCDGSVIENNNNLYLKVSLMESDYKHLEKLRDAMSSEHTIKFYKVTGFETNNKEARFIVGSSYIGGVLRNKYGMIPHRSETKLVTDSVPKHLVKHFIRGVFDADGSITTYWNQEKEAWKPNLKMSLQLYSYEKLIDFIQNHWIEIGFKENKVKTIKRNKGRDGNATGINFSGVKQVTWLLDYLYGDASIYLDRKMEDANRAKNAELDRNQKRIS